MAGPPPDFDGTLVAALPGGIWAHPGAAPLLGPELQARRAVVELVRRAADRASAEAFTTWPVERATLLFGSGAMPGIVPHPGDLDLVLRIRHRPIERVGDPAQVQARVAPASAAFLRGLCLALAQEDARFLRLVTVWDGPFAGASRVPAGATVSWSLPAVACRRTLSAIGAVTLEQAARECSIIKLSLLLHVHGRLMPVELAVESSFVLPGGVCDVSAAFTAFWLGKVSFSEAEARIASGHERELATLFPDRYSPAAFAWEAIHRTISGMIQRLDVRKIVGVSALLHAISGDAAALEATRRTAASPGAQLAGFGARLSTIVKHRWANDLDDAVSAVLMADLAADIAAATSLPEHARWSDALASAAAPSSFGPEQWAAADRYSELMHEIGTRHLAVELRAHPRVLATEDPHGVARALAAIPPPAAY